MGGSEKRYPPIIEERRMLLLWKLISHASKVMLKILQTRLQQYVKFQMFKLFLEKAEEPEIKLPTSLDHQESKRVPEKHLLLLYWLCWSLSLCGLQQTVENSSRDGNTRPPDLPLEKAVCRFLTRPVTWPGIPITFRIFHSLLWSTQSKALA